MGSARLLSMMSTLPYMLMLALAAPGDGAEPAVDYMREIKPLLAKHCVSCHGERQARGGLRLDTALGGVRGGKSGPSIVPAHADESLLIEAVRGEGGSERMPYRRPPLSDLEIERLQKWINQGALAPADERPTHPANSLHWAFAPPTRPTVPRITEDGAGLNPIDLFIREKLTRAGLKPSPEADRITQIRRLTLDLTGLPPTPEEVLAYTSDPSPRAYEALVDRLLASPRYGERWGRIWLDQARYADSNGYSVDAPRIIWKYRDWVINALNQDLPFNDFVIDQVAGDLRPQATLAQRVATGFLRCAMLNQEGGIDLEQFRVETVIDRANTTATVFLGLTLGCAQCHDHKFDPFSQREYYQFLALFNNTDSHEIELASQEELARRGAAPQQIRAFHTRFSAELPEADDQERFWECTLSPELKGSFPEELKAALAIDRAKRNERQRQWVFEEFLARSPRYQVEYLLIASLRAREARKYETTLVVEERKERRPTHVHLGGDFTRKGEAVTPGVPSVLPKISSTSYSSAVPNRWEFAQWLVDPSNPLTARVAVNRIWQTYFGRGLVETDDDFGTQGTSPTHPELLDWLASEFIAQGWSLKALHRLIVTSHVYRQSSHARPDGDAVDPLNKLLARQARLRLDAEIIRDSSLAVSDLLTSRIGGPSVFPPQPEGVMTFGQLTRTWTVSSGPDRYRRGMYTFFWRTTPYPALIVFDAPIAIQPCTRRNRSNTPLQALTLLNDSAFVECAQALAARIQNQPQTGDTQRLQYAFQLCLGRSATDNELRSLQRLLDEERAEPQAFDRERAAWVSVARVLLNLDEFMTRE